MSITRCLILGSCGLVLGLMIHPAFALEPQHQVAGSYGGTRLYAHDSVVISPNAKITAYSTTTTDLSTLAANSVKKDPLCHSILNSGDVDYFIPWRTARAGAGNLNEWTTFLALAQAGDVTNLRVGSCCYPRINPNRPCGVSYPLGKRTAGALPMLSATATPAIDAASAEVPNYGADGDLSFDIVGYNRKESWLCQNGEWFQSSSQGGCFQNGQCNYYSESNPTGYAGASINALPASNRAGLLCNGVDPVAISGGKFPYPESTKTAPPYGTAGWAWKCPGQQGGTSEQCSAGYNGGAMSGVCGYANGRTYATAPANPNLCYVGTPTSMTTTVTNVGYEKTTWKWGCGGVNGGASTSSSACSSTTPAPATPVNASCGTYASGSRSAGLLSFEVSGGLPIASGLCGTGVLTPGSVVTGNGTAASPWIWTCFNATNNTTARCTNKYTNPGVCGVMDGTAVPTQPTVAANMCKSGRWYNKATSGMSASTAVWNSTTQKWSWACLGHNQSTGAVVNDQCEASKCTECIGSVSSAVSVPFAGRYLSCDFPKADGELTFGQTLTRQSDPSDVSMHVYWEGDPVGTVSIPTNVANGYCAPCYLKQTGVSNPLFKAPSCGLSVPTHVTVGQ